KERLADIVFCELFYASVSQAEPPIYPNHYIAKLECTGHIQKCMGKRLMAKVKECKGKSYEDRGCKYTGIGGAVRLTQKKNQQNSRPLWSSHKGKQGRLCCHETC
ncbi:unnamed protein product, partial [Owenia fusiformis]